MSALEFSRGRVARCIRNAVSRRGCMRRFARKRGSRSARHVSALSPRVLRSPRSPLARSSRSSRSSHSSRSFPERWSFLARRFVLASGPAGSLDYREIFLLRQSVHVPFLNDLARVLLNFCFVFHLCFRPSLETRDARRACVFTVYRHMQASVTLCRDTTFKFSKATTFRMPVRIYVRRKKCSTHKSPPSLGNLYTLLI